LDLRIGYLQFSDWRSTKASEAEAVLAFALLGLERRTPVLTMELKENLPPNLQPFEKLQDIIGNLVMLETGKVKHAPVKSGGDENVQNKNPSLEMLPVALEH
jgi:hypothetical protein